MKNRLALRLSFSIAFAVWLPVVQASPPQIVERPGSVSDSATAAFGYSHSNWFTYIARLVQPIKLDGYRLDVGIYAEAPRQDKTITVTNACQLTLLPSRAPYLSLKFGDESFQVKPSSPGTWRGFNANSTAYIDVSITDHRTTNGDWADFSILSLTRSSVLDTFQFIKTKSGTSSEECHFLKNSNENFDAKFDYDSEVSG